MNNECDQRDRRCTLPNLQLKEPGGDHQTQYRGEQWAGKRPRKRLSDQADGGTVEVKSRIGPTSVSMVRGGAEMRQDSITGDSSERVCHVRRGVRVSGVLGNEESK